MESHIEQLYDKAYQQGRQDAINEFRKECESASYIPIGYGYYVVDMSDVRLVADLMKEQVKREAHD